MLKKLLLLGSTLFLTHCAQQPLYEVENLSTYQRHLAKVDTWQVNGRLLVRIPGDAETVNVKWQNQQADYNIRLSGPLGMGATMIYGKPGEVRMEQGGEEPVVARSAEDLLYTQLGREIPISDLGFWVRGLPAPFPKAQQMNIAQEGMLEHLEQAGWDIHYEKYMAVDSWNMPKKITAVRDDLKLTLVVSKWTLSSQRPL